MIYELLWAHNPPKFEELLSSITLESSKAEHTLTIDDSRSSLKMPFDYKLLQRVELKNTLWILLVHTGYLCLMDEKTENECVLRIPNRELHMTWTGWLAVPACTDSAILYTDLPTYLLQGKEKEFQQKFAQEIEAMLSIRNMHGNVSIRESVYVAYFLGIINHLRHRKWRITGDREAGGGYFDVQMVPPPNVSQTGVILEFKKLHNSNAEKSNFEQILQGKVQEALKQITIKKHNVIFDEESLIKDIYHYGVACCGKHVLVEKRKFLRRNINGSISYPEAPQDIALSDEPDEPDENALATDVQDKMQLRSKRSRSR